MLTAAGATVRVGRTGYTGEPLCFELFVAAGAAAALWDVLVAGGAAPAGLGARDTLRLEAGLPLYGFELGTDDDGVEIPIFAISLAKLAVSLSPLKGDFIGRAALARQHDAFARIVARDYSRQSRPAATGAAHRRRGPRRRAHAARRSCSDERHVGYVTSGTSVPYWIVERRGARLAPDRRARPALDRPGLPRLRRRRRRRRDGRHPRHAGAGPRRALPPAQRRAAAGRGRSSTTTSCPRSSCRRATRSARRGGCSARRSPTPPGDRRECRQSHPLGDDGLAARASRLGHGPGVSLRRAPPVRGLLRRRALLLPGHGVHRRRRAPPRGGAHRVPGLRRDRDPPDQRPDGQHGRLQRPRRLRQSRRPQSRAATHPHGDEPPHRQGRPPERPAHGRAARLRGPRPAHRRAGGRELPGARRQPLSGRRGRDAGADRPLPARAHRLRAQHGAAPRADRRDQGASSQSRASTPSSSTTRPTCSDWSGRTSRSRSPRAPTS